MDGTILRNPSFSWMRTVSRQRTVAGDMYGLLGLGVPLLELSNHNSITITGRFFESFPVQNGDASPGIGNQSRPLQDAG